MKLARLSCFVAIDFIGCSVEMLNFICGNTDNNDLRIHFLGSILIWIQ